MLIRTDTNDKELPEPVKASGGSRKADFSGASPVASALGIRSGATPRGN